MPFPTALLISPVSVFFSMRICLKFPFESCASCLIPLIIKLYFVLFFHFSGFDIIIYYDEIKLYLCITLSIFFNKSIRSKL